MATRIDIGDDHPIREFVIRTGNVKDGFQRACEHIAFLEQRVEKANGLLDDAGIEHSGRTLEERVREVVEERNSIRKTLIRSKALAAEEEGSCD